MTQPRICPECHAEIPTDAPPGVCPYCALRAGLRWDDATRPGRQPGPGTPLAPEALSRGLPEVEDFELIGPGGMGTVYKARHRELDRLVAVKVLHPHLQQYDVAFAERFLREAKTLARLDHPNIVRVYDVGHREQIYYFMMEFVEGVNLREAMTTGQFTPAEALALVPQICEALQYAHDQGVVHRDIKPENILLDQSGAPKIADFGLALLSDASTESRLTQTAQVMGTPHYMAPEQIEHPDTVDHRADIYALGVVFYEMLTGELPVGRFPPPSQKVEVDVRLDRVVLRTLEKEPRLRYQQASQLRTEVQSLSDPNWLPAEPATDLGWRRTRRGRRRRWPNRRFEYRSTRTLWGMPLVHVTTSGDPNGVRVALARGVIAIGDAAVGLVAIGGFAVGGVAIGGIGLGVVTLSGVAFGLALAFGGVAIGGYALGSLALGAADAVGALALTLDGPTELARRWLSLNAWSLSTLVVTASAVSLIVWLGDRNEEPAK